MEVERQRPVNGPRDERSSAHQGFTLIEVLVVVAVVAVLIAILLPCLGLARQRAKRAPCGAKLRQIGLAWQVYLTDNKGQFYQGVGANIKYGGWRGKKELFPRPLNPYVSVSLPLDAKESEAQVFHCPVDKGGVPGDFVDLPAYHAIGTSYQTNLFLVGANKYGAFSERTANLDAKISAGITSMNLGKVSVSHSRLLLMGDWGWVTQWDPGNPDHGPAWHGKPDTYMMAFLDGHVSFTPIVKGDYIRDTYTVVPFKGLSDPNE